MYTCGLLVGMCKELKKYCAIYGNQKALADACVVSPQAVTKWLRKVPAERVLSIEAATDFKVTRYQLRPDIYPVDKGAAK